MHLKKTGFTLVELAVVVFIIGMLSSLGLQALNAQMARASISTTKKEEGTIKDALISYLGRNKRLPCPSTNTNPPDGIETRNSSITAGNWDCIADFGIVPYATLGLPKSTALDGWGNFFSYAVSSKWTLTYNTSTTPVAGGTTTNDATQAFNVGITGKILVNDRAASSGNPIIPISSSTTGGPAAVFIVSHGKNGLGAFTSKGTQNVSPATGTDEQANVVNATTWALPPAFYQREYTDNAAAYGTYGAFDDITQFLNPSDFITPLMKDGSLKSASSQWAEQITNINNALIGAMFNNQYCAPLGNQTPSINQTSFALQQTYFQQLLAQNGIPAVDPWGGTLTYTPGSFCRLNNNGKYETSYCNYDCGYTACSLPTTSMAAFSVTTSTTTPAVTIRPQTISTLMATYPSLLNGCPAP